MLLAVEFEALGVPVQDWRRGAFGLPPSDLLGISLLWLKLYPTQDLFGEYEETPTESLVVEVVTVHRRRTVFWNVPLRGGDADESQTLAQGQYVQLSTTKETRQLEVAAALVGQSIGNRQRIHGHSPTTGTVCLWLFGRRTRGYFLSRPSTKGLGNGFEHVFHKMDLQVCKAQKSLKQ